MTITIQGAMNTGVGALNPAVSGATKSTNATTANAQAAATSLFGNAIPGVGSKITSTKDASGLTNNIWVTTADDKLAKSDIYKEKSTDPITSIQSFKASLSDYSKTLNDAIRGGRNIASKVTSAKELYSSVSKILSSKDALAKVLNTSSALRSGLSTLGLDNPVTTSILGAVTDSGNLYAKVNGVTSKVSSSQLKNLSSASDLITNFTGVATAIATTDVDAKIGTAVGLVKTTTNMGVGNAFSLVCGTFENDTAGLRKIAAACLPSTVSNSDTSNLKAMAEVTGNRGLSCVNPSVLNDFSEVYGLPMGDYSTLKCYDDILDSYKAVDSDWMIKARAANAAAAEPDTSVNLVTVINGSDVFKTTITEGTQMSCTKAGGVTDTTSFMAMGAMFQPVNVADTLGTQFPMTVISDTKIKSTSVEDPTITSI